MAVDVATKRLEGRAHQRPPAVGEATRSAPVQFWAVLGAAFLVLEAYVITSWIASGDATPTADGPDPIPEWMMVVARTIEVTSVLGWGAILYFFLIRPWRRAGRITADGLLLIAVLLLWWQDPLLNYGQTWTTINTAFVNFGNWTEHVPGALSPTAGRFAEAPLWAFMAYGYALFGGSVLATAFMRRVHARWPRIWPVGLVGICFVFLAACDTLMEVGWMRLGMFTYAGAHESVTLFHGHYYQFPIYEAILLGGFWTALASLRYFRNDKGQTVAERGAESVRTGPRRRTLLRLLALVGVVNLSYLVIYNVPAVIIGLNSEPWPRDIVERSYLTDQICGEGTNYACPGPAVPVPRGDSAHLAPRGELVPAQGDAAEGRALESFSDTGTSTPPAVGGGQSRPGSTR